MFSACQGSLKMSLVTDAARLVPPPVWPCGPSPWEAHGDVRQAPAPPAVKDGTPRAAGRPTGRAGRGQLDGVRRPVELRAMRLPCSAPVSPAWVCRLPWTAPREVSGPEPLPFPTLHLDVRRAAPWRWRLAEESLEGQGVGSEPESESRFYFPVLRLWTARWVSSSPGFPPCQTQAW